MEGSGHKGQRPTSSIHRWWWRWEFVAFCLYSISVGKGKLQKICCSLDTRVNYEQTAEHIDVPLDVEDGQTQSYSVLYMGAIVP